MVCSHCPTPRPIKRVIKMGYVGLCGSVHTAQRETSTQIPIWICANLSVSVSVLVSVSVSVSGSVKMIEKHLNPSN